jgi:uncharacterized integral membrane protein (TIGR00697 family)
MSSLAQKPHGYVGERYFFACCMVFSALLLISNTIAVKIVSFGAFAVAGGIVCFPISYVFGDVLTEVYGYSKTRRAIWWAFFCLAMMSFFYTMATYLPPAPFYKDQDKFETIFTQVPRVTLGSFVAFLIGAFLNSYVMSKMKIWSDGKWLWLRFVSSTIVAEAADSVVFIVIAFGGIFSASDLLTVGATGFVLKTAYEIIALPLTYTVVRWLKRAEGIDVYDHGISYNPLRLN